MLSLRWTKYNFSNFKKFGLTKKTKMALIKKCIMVNAPVLLNLLFCNTLKASFIRKGFKLVKNSENRKQGRNVITESSLTCFKLNLWHSSNLGRSQLGGFKELEWSWSQFGKLSEWISGLAPRQWPEEASTELQISTLWPRYFFLGTK